MMTIIFWIVGIIGFFWLLGLLLKLLFTVLGITLSLLPDILYTVLSALWYILLFGAGAYLLIAFIADFFKY